MPLYFFDVIDNGVVSRDEFGCELSGFDEAREQAIILLPDMARDGMPDGEAHSFACRVRDESGRILYRGTLTYRGEKPAIED